MAGHEGVGGPVGDIAGGDHIGMAGKEQAAAALPARGKEIIDGIGAIALKTQARDGKAEFGEFVGEQILHARCFGGDRAAGDEAFEQADGIVGRKISHEWLAVLVGWKNQASGSGP